MKGSTKMEDYDGFLNFSQKIERTKILPLRWIGNALSYPATRSLVKAFDLQDEGDFGYRFKFHSKVFKYLNKPYEWWGTVYKVDMAAIKKSLVDDPKYMEIMDKLGLDYEDGTPYWDKNE
jgi:hypothetical protein